MLRKIAGASLFAMVLSGTFLVAGCEPADENKPYSLTGENSAMSSQEHQEWRTRMQYTDDKGRYHPELAAAGRPIRPMPD